MQRNQQRGLIQDRLQAQQDLVDYKDTTAQGAEFRRMQAIMEEEERAKLAEIAARTSTPYLGYMYNGEYTPGAEGGAPEGAQSIYAADLPPSGLADIISRASGDASQTIPVEIGGELYDLSPQEAAALGYRPLSPEDEPKTPPLRDPGLAAMTESDYWRRNLLEMGYPLSVNYGKSSYDFAYPKAFDRFTALADSMPLDAALKATIAEGLGDPISPGGIGGEGLESIYADGGVLKRKKTSWTRFLGLEPDEEVTEGEAVKLLVDSGVPEVLARAYVKQLGEADELGY